MPKQINDNDVDVHQCTIQGHFIKAKLNLRFPCSFFIQWKSINGKQLIQSNNKYKAKNSIVQFNQTLVFTTEMLWDKRQKTYLKKDSIIKVNLVSASRPDQIKLVGQMTIDISQVINSVNKHIQGSKKLAYCSVDAQLMFQIKLIQIKRSDKLLSDLDKSTFSQEIYSIQQGVSRMSQRSRSKSRQSRNIIQRVKSESNLKQREITNNNPRIDDQYQRGYIVIEQDNSRSPSALVDEDNKSLKSVKSGNRIDQQILNFSPINDPVKEQQNKQVENKLQNVKKVEQKSKLEQVVLQNINLKNQFAHNESKIQLLQERLKFMMKQLQESKLQRQIERIQSESTDKAVLDMKISQLQRKITKLSSQIQTKAGQIQNMQRTMKQKDVLIIKNQKQLSELKIINTELGIKLQQATNIQSQSVFQLNQQILTLNQRFLQSDSMIQTMKQQSQKLLMSLKVKDQRLQGLEQLISQYEMQGQRTKQQFTLRKQGFSKQIQGKNQQIQTLTHQIQSVTDLLHQRDSQLKEFQLQMQKRIAKIEGQKLVIQEQLITISNQNQLLVQQLSRKKINEQQEMPVQSNHLMGAQQKQKQKQRQKQQEQALQNQQIFRLKTKIMQLETSLQQNNQLILKDKQVYANRVNQLQIDKQNLKNQLSKLENMYLTLQLDQNHNQLNNKQNVNQLQSTTQNIIKQPKIQTSLPLSQPHLSQPQQAKQIKQQMKQSTKQQVNTKIKRLQQRYKKQFQDTVSQYEQQIRIIKQQFQLYTQHVEMYQHQNQLKDKINTNQQPIFLKENNDDSVKKNEPINGYNNCNKEITLKQQQKNQTFNNTLNIDNKPASSWNEVQLNQLRDQLSSLNQQYTNLLKRNEQQKDKIALIQIQKSQLQSHNIQSSKQIEIFIKQIEQLNRQIQTLNKQIQTLKLTQFYPKMKQIQYHQQQHYQNYQPSQQHTQTQNFQHQSQLQNNRQSQQKKQYKSKQRQRKFSQQVQDQLNIKIQVNQVPSIDQSNHSQDHQYVLTEDDYLPNRVRFHVSAQGKKQRLSRQNLDRSLQQINQAKTNQQIDKTESQKDRKPKNTKQVEDQNTQLKQLLEQRQQIQKSLTYLQSQCDRKSQLLTEMQHKLYETERINQQIKQKVKQNEVSMYHSNQTGQNAIQQLYSKLTELEQDLKLKDQIIMEMQSSMAQTYNLKFQLAQLMETKTEMQSSLRAKQDKINELEEIISQLKKNLQQVTSKQQYHQNISKQHQNNNQQLLHQEIKSQSITNNQQLINQYDSKIGELQQNIRFIEQMNNQLKVQNNLLNEDMRLIRQQNITVQEECLSYKQQLLSLQHNFNQLNDKNTQLQTQLKKYLSKSVVLGQDNLMLRQQLQLHQHGTQIRKRKNSLSLSTSRRNIEIQLPSIEQIAQKNQSECHVSNLPQSIAIQSCTNSVKNQAVQFNDVESGNMTRKNMNGQKSNYYYEAKTIPIQQPAIDISNTNTSGTTFQNQLNDIKTQLQILREQLIFENRQHNNLKNLFQQKQKLISQLELSLSTKEQLLRQGQQKLKYLQTDFKSVQKEYDQYREIYQNEVNTWIISKQEGYNKGESDQKVINEQIKQFKQEKQKYVCQIQTLLSQNKALKDQLQMSKNKLQMDSKMIKNNSNKISAKAINIQTKQDIQTQNKQRLPTLINENDHVLKQLQSLITQRQKSLVDLQQKISQKQNLINSIQSKCQQLQKQNSKIITQNNNLFTQTTKQSIQIQQLNQQVFELTQKLLLIQKQKQDLAQQAIGTSTLIKQSQDQIKQLRQSITNREQKINELQTLKHQIYLLNNQSQIIKAQLVQYKSNINLKEQQILEYNQKIEECQQRLISKQNQIQQVIKQNQKSQSQKNNIIQSNLTQIYQLKQLQNTLNTQIHSFNQTITQLDQTIAQLQTTINILSLEKGKLSLVTQHLKQQLYQQTQRHQTTKKQYKSSVHSQQQLQIKLQLIKNQIPTLQQQLFAQVLNVDQLNHKNIELLSIIQRHQTKQQVMKQHLQMLQQQSTKIFSIVKQKQIQSENLYQSIAEIQEDNQKLRIQILKLQQIIFSKDNLLTFYQNSNALSKINFNSKTSLSQTPIKIQTPLKTSFKQQTPPKSQTTIAGSKQQILNYNSSIEGGPMINPAGQSWQNKLQNDQKTQKINQLTRQNQDLMNKHKQFIQILSKRASVIIQNQKLKRQMQKINLKLDTQLNNNQQLQKTIQEITKINNFKISNLITENSRLKQQQSNQSKSNGNYLQEQLKSESNTYGKPFNQQNSSSTLILNSMMRKKSSQVAQLQSTLKNNQIQNSQLKKTNQALSSANQNIKTIIKQKQLEILQLKNKITSLQSALFNKNYNQQISKDQFKLKVINTETNNKTLITNNTNNTNKQPNTTNQTKASQSPQQLNQLVYHLKSLIDTKSLEKLRQNTVQLLLNKNKLLEQSFGNYDHQKANQLQQAARRVSRQIQKIKASVVKTQLNSIEDKSKLISSMKNCQNVVLQLITIAQSLKQNNNVLLDS